MDVKVYGRGWMELELGPADWADTQHHKFTGWRNGMENEAEEEEEDRGG